MDLQRLERLRRQGLRRQGRPRDPQPPLPRRQHRPGRDPRATPRPPRRTRGSSRTRRSASTSSASARGARSTASCSARSGPRCPTLKPGGKYLVEVVVRTLGLGHPFSQGTVDSNEIWVELIATAGRPGHRPLGRDRARRHGRSRTRTSSTSTCSTATATGSTAATRRTSSSRSTTSRSRPGAGQVVHFGLEVPEGVDGPDHARGEGQLPQVRPQVHGLRLRQGEGARAAGRRDGDATRSQLPVEGGPAGDERALADQGRPGSAGTTTASACCSKGATRGARRAS